YRIIYLKCKPFQLRVIALFLLFSCSFLTASAQRAINGRVTDETNNGIPGVSVTIKGQKQGAVTNGQGQFTINAEPGQTLVFTYIGYTPKEVAAGTSTTLNVNLVPQQNDLNEVVVIGYGTAKKGDITGAIAGIGAKEIERLPVQNALQAVQGRVSGVDV